MRSSAAHFADLCAMHGRRDDITLFPTFLVLQAMAEAADAKRLQDLTNKRLQQQAAKSGG